MPNIIISTLPIRSNNQWDSNGNLSTHLYIGANLQRIISGTKKNSLFGIKQLLHAHAQYMILLESPTHKTAKQLIATK